MSLITNSNKVNGETITFYSYKGGNGRTMALSNVATILAQQNPGAKILMIDWDLEAPGLHRFFFQEPLFSSFHNENMKESYMKINNQRGLIDLFRNLNNAISKYDLADDDIVTKLFADINFDDFIIPTSLNNLYLLKAGCFDANYSDKVNTFNWEKLYNKAPSLIRLFSEKLTAQYKYVLIDSRTGFTDTSGICTMLLPQKLVIVFTPNRQSYTGVKELIIKAINYRRQSDDMRPLLIYPLPSRIEFSRDDLRADWRHGNNEKGIVGYQTMFQDIFKDIYSIDECSLEEYFEEVQIQQSPNYAYGEEIAIVSEKTRDTFSLSKSYETFTQWLVNSFVPWKRKEDDELSKDTIAAADFNSIGLEFQEIGDSEKALIYFKKALTISEELKDKEGIAKCHNNIATVYNRLGLYDEALGYSKKALEIHKSLNLINEMTKDYIIIGMIYQNKKNYTESLKWYDNVLEIDPRNKNALNGKGQCLKNLKRYEESLLIYDKGLEIDPNDIETKMNKEVIIEELKRQQSVNGNRQAIIIGINEYELSDGIPRLNGAENDAREIRDRFLNYGKFIVSDNHYLLGRQATRKNILRAVGEIFQKDIRRDLIIFYFSGHGMMDENDEGYLAPYDMDPENPFVSGINLSDLKKVIFHSKSKAGIIFILDCCYAGIAIKDTKSLAPPEQKIRNQYEDNLQNIMSPPEQKIRNLYADHLQNIIKSSDTEVVGSDADFSGKGKIVLASSEADEVSKEKNDCIHGANSSPHSHGAFSYHLIEGLDGKADELDNGVITIDNLRKYIEEQMRNENRQKIVYHISQASNIENIKIAVAQGKFEEKIKKLIVETDDILSRKKDPTAFSNVFDLQDAAYKINELIDLDRENKEIARLQGIIDDELNLYKNPTIRWINNNIRVAQRKVNEIRNQLYEEELPDLVNRLSFSELLKVPNSYLMALVYVFAEVEKNTRFESLEDPKLKSFVSKLRVAFDNIENEPRH